MPKSNVGFVITLFHSTVKITDDLWQKEIQTEPFLNLRLFNRKIFDWCSPQFKFPLVKKPDFFQKRGESFADCCWTLSNCSRSPAFLTFFWLKIIVICIFKQRGKVLPIVGELFRIVWFDVEWCLPIPRFFPGILPLSYLVLRRTPIGVDESQNSAK